MPSLRALAFGDLPSGQAKAAQRVGSVGAPGVGGQPSGLPGEAEVSTPLPTPENLSRTSLGLLAQGGEQTGGVPVGASDAPGAASGAPSGEVEFGASDTPVGGPISSLPGFVEPETTATAGQTAPTALPKSGAQAAISDQPTGPSPIEQQLPGAVKVGSKALSKLGEPESGGAAAVSGAAPAVPPTFNFAPGAFDSIPGAASPGTLDTGLSGFGAEATAPAIGAGVDLGASTVGGLGSSLAGGAEGASSLAALEALGPSAASAGLGGLVMGGIGMIPTVWEGLNDFFRAQKNAETAIRDTKAQRQRFTQTSWPGFAGGSKTLGDVAGVDPSLPPEEQIARLQGLANQADYALRQGPDVSQFISSHGGQVTGKGLQIPGVDTSGIEGVSGKLSRDAVLAYTAALDRLAQLGTPTVPSEATHYVGDWNPQGLLGILMAQGGAPQISAGPQDITPEGEAGFGGDYTSLLTPEELQSLSQPGQRIQTLAGVLKRLNPSFASTDLGGEFNALGANNASPEAAAAPTVAPGLPSLGGLAVNPAAAALALQRQKDEEQAALQGVR